MPNPNELRVKPVKRYRIPKYPSHLDPDPTLYPQRIPIPIGNKLLAAVATLGIASSSSCARPSNGSEPPQQLKSEAAPPKKPYQATHVNAAGERVTLTKPHALDVAFSGLPHRTSPYGTGVPNYISEEIAREVIERVFREEGYRLKADQKFEEEGLAFAMHGFDPEKKIGYVFGDASSLDMDAYISWTAPKAINTQARVDAIVTGARWFPELEPWAKEIKEAKTLPDVAKREAAIEAIVTRHRAHLLSLKEIQTLNDKLPKSKRFVAVISQFDQRFVIPYVDYKAMQKLQQIADVGKREAAMKELQMKAARKAIEKLELCVRDYIAWARSQGAG